MSIIEDLVDLNFAKKINSELIKEDDEEFSNKVSKFWECNWLELIDTPTIVKWLQNKCVGNIRCSDNNILVSAAAFLLAFAQENFTGPSLSDEYKKFIEINWHKDCTAMKELVVDAEDINLNVRYPEFLLAAKLLLNKLDNNKWITKWWKMRYIFIHQSVLEEITNSLYEEYNSLAESLLKNLGDINNTEIQTLLLIELAGFYINFHHIKKSESVLETIYQKLGIQFNIEGSLGYRTKYQRNPLPQLVLKTHQNEHQFKSAKDTNGATNLPKLLKLDDEVRLETIKFVSNDCGESLNLPSVIQLLILVQVKYLMRSQPKDLLSDEIIEPYITTLLHQETGPLSARLATLLINIRKEANHKRTVERSFKQCEELLNIINGTRYSIQEKLSYSFASFLLPKWEIKKQLGDLMVSLGLIKNALDLYIEIQALENIIECYTLLDLRHKAAEVIKEELKTKKSVKLYCLLGDAVGDPSYYEIAWKLSNESSGRAQRHWGSYYFAKKDYESAIPHLQKSLEINSLQEIIWLKLGYAALSLEQWEIAASAYLRYTHIEPSGFESWNNLAKCLIKLGDKKRAHKILHEALKCNFNNWKIWENFLIVSIDTGNFEDAINAYNRLVELKEQERYLDLEVLQLLVNAIMNNLPDAQGRNTNALRKKANQLLSHQCVLHANVPELWQLSACLSDNPLSKAQKLQKSYKAYTQNDVLWSKNLDSCKKIIILCKDLCDNSLAMLENYNESNKSVVMSQLTSARLSAQGCIKAVENNDEYWEEKDSFLNELKLVLDKITTEIKNRM